MGVDAAWLEASWGKFRSFERGLANRMSRAELAGARAFWEVLVGTGGEPGEVRSEMTRLLSGELGEAEANGVSVFGTWFLSERSRLQRFRPFAELVDPTHTRDSVTAELL